MIATFVLILFLENCAVRVGEYRDYASCETAGIGASKSRSVEFICVKTDRR